VDILGQRQRWFSGATRQRYADFDPPLGPVWGRQRRREGLGGSLRYFVPQGKRGLFYAAASGDIVRNPETADLLLLGGENACAVTPALTRAVNNRALFTVEERALYGLVPVPAFPRRRRRFYDIGRAWGGPFQNPVNPGWLSDVGFGLRIISTRSAFGNVLHVDVAFR